MATSKVYTLPETAVKFNGEAGADVAFSMEAVATGAGRVSAQYDLGSAARAGRYGWYCETLMQATPTQYKAINLFAAAAPDYDATQIDGDIGNADAALSDLDQLLNMHSIGAVIIEDAATTKMVGSGIIIWPHRYITIAGHNDSGATINATDSNFIFQLVPLPWQGQAT